MNNKKFLVLIFFTTQSTLFSFTYTDKTFLAPRSQISQLPIEHTITHRATTNDIGNDTGVTLAASLFYYESSDEGRKYFGFRRNKELVVKKATGKNPTDSFPSQSIIHDPNENQTILYINDWHNQTQSKTWSNAL